jgi:hypothetical protein
MLASFEDPGRTALRAALARGEPVSCVADARPTRIELADGATVLIRSFELPIDPPTRLLALLRERWAHPHRFGRFLVGVRGTAVDIACRLDPAEFDEPGLRSIILQMDTFASGEAWPTR